MFNSILELKTKKIDYRSIFIKVDRDNANTPIISIYINRYVID